MYCLPQLLWYGMLIAVLLVICGSAPRAQSDEAGGWKPHLIRQGDGQGGWVLKEAECQILRYRERGWTAGFGVAQMDNGEIVLLGICSPRKSLWYGERRRK